METRQKAIETRESVVHIWAECSYTQRSPIRTGRMCARTQCVYVHTGSISAHTVWRCMHKQRLSVPSAHVCKNAYRCVAIAGQHGTHTGRMCPHAPCLYAHRKSSCTHGAAQPPIAPTLSEDASTLYACTKITIIGLAHTLWASR